MIPGTVHQAPPHLPATTPGISLLLHQSLGHWPSKLPLVSIWLHLSHHQPCILGKGWHSNWLAGWEGEARGSDRGQKPEGALEEVSQHCLTWETLQELGSAQRLHTETEHIVGCPTLQVPMYHHLHAGCASDSSLTFVSLGGQYRRGRSGDQCSGLGRTESLKLQLVQYKLEPPGLPLILPLPSHPA